MKTIKLFLENYKLKKRVNSLETSLSRLNSEYCKLERELKVANWENIDLLEIIEELERKLKESEE